MRSIIPLIPALAAVLLLGAMLPAYAQDAEEPVFKLTGRYQNLLVAAGTEDTAGQDTDTLVFDLNRLRLTPEFRFSDNFILHADVDNELLSQTTSTARHFRITSESLVLQRSVEPGAGQRNRRRPGLPAQAAPGLRQAGRGKNGP